MTTRVTCDTLKMQITDKKRRFFEKMPEYTFFYARISTKDQNLDRQLEQARALDIPEARIFADIGTGSTFTRNQYESLLKQLREGDTVVVASLDRLGRNYHETGEAYEHITKQIKAHIKILDMPLVQSTEDDITAELVNDIIIKLLLYIGEKELSLQKERQKQGIEIAKAKGVYTGRQPVKFDKDRFIKLYESVGNYEITRVKSAELLGVSLSTFNRLCKEYETSSGRFSKVKN